MNTDTKSHIRGLPTVKFTEDGERFTIRPMTHADGPALLEFFVQVPERDRRYLKEDVGSPDVVEKWARELDFSRVIPLLAVIGERVIGDATLHLSRSPARMHVGEMRVVVHPRYRGQGVGRHLMLKIAEVATDLGIEKLVFEIVENAEDAARHTAQSMHFVPAAVLTSHVKDVDGTYRSVVILEADVQKAANVSVVF